MMKLIGVLAAAAAFAQAPPPSAERFDMVVRSDFFAGFAGDADRLKKAMDLCERVIAENPAHAEALVWHGSGLAFQAGAAFRKGDRETGMQMWGRGVAEMDRAVEIQPDNIGVRIPRGAALLVATRTMESGMARPLLEKALGDYERVLELQASYFSTLGDHPKGEILFGLAEGYSRLGDADKARTYFNRLLTDAPGSGQTAKAKQWLADGTLPKAQGLGCVGCHK
jgi:tetratricopeptide (TPR) repeat protein